MIILALDTSTLQGSVGWVRLGGEAADAPVESYAEGTASAGPGHAETLLTRIAELLAFGEIGAADVDLLVYGRGPGTFTGLRIGLATVKGLALPFSTPIIGLSSLEALALSAPGEGLVATLIDARRSELFAALWRLERRDGVPVAVPVLPERVAPAAEIAEELGREIGERRALVIGNGVAPYLESIEANVGAQTEVVIDRHLAPNAYWMARIGWERFLANGPDDLDGSEPTYLREPDARLPGSPR